MCIDYKILLEKAGMPPLHTPLSIIMYPPHRICERLVFNFILEKWNAQFWRSGIDGANGSIVYIRLRDGSIWSYNNFEWLWSKHSFNQMALIDILNPDITAAIENNHLPLSKVIIFLADFFIKPFYRYPVISYAENNVENPEESYDCDLYDPSRCETDSESGSDSDNE